MKNDGETLIEVEDYGLEDLLKKINPKETILLTERGKPADFKEFDLKSPAILIGAFSHGDFSPEVLGVLKKFNPRLVSLGERSFTSLYVTNRVICLLENSLEEELKRWR